MININRLTVKSQEALEASQRFAQEQHHTLLEPLHILWALLTQEEGVVRSVMAAMGVSVESFIRASLNELTALPRAAAPGTLNLSRQTLETLENAQIQSQHLGDEFVSTEHFLLALITLPSPAQRILIDGGITYDRVLKTLSHIRGSTRVTDPEPESSYQAIEKYTINITDLARQKKIDPVIGREQEIRRVIQVLSRRTKNNPVLIGEAGTGKTAIVEGLAQRIVSGDIPEGLKNKDLLNIDIGALVAGTKFRGEFEQRLKSLLKEIKQSSGKFVLFIDELHTVIGAGAIEGSMDAANLLKPSLARGELRMIGATTLKEYQRHIEKDPAFERRFQPVYVNESSVEDTIAILRGIKEKYEIHHGVRITDNALVAAANLSHRYISDRALPDKAIDLIDEAASSLRMEIETMPEELDELKRTIVKKEIEREALKKEPLEAARERLGVLEADIETLKKKEHDFELRWRNERESIAGIRELKSNIETAHEQAEMAERKGELGTVAELRYGKIPQLQQELRNREKGLSALSQGERMLKEEVTETDIAVVVSRWTGIPATQLLKTEAQRLIHAEEELNKRVIGQTEAIVAVSNALRRSRVGLSDRQRPLGTFLFLGPTGVGKTELAKALAAFMFDNEQALVHLDMSEYMERHAAARLIGSPPGYVGYEEGGQLTEKIRRRPYAVILFDEIEKAHPDFFNILLQILDEGRLTDGKGRIVNFKNTIVILTSNLGNQLIREYTIGFQPNKSAQRGESIDEEEMRSKLMEVLKDTFKPEFLNRLDDIIIFHPLSREHMMAIVDIQLNLLTERLVQQEVALHVTTKARALLAERGYDPSYGARPLKRLIEHEIINPLAQQILEHTTETANKKATVDAKDTHFSVRLR